MIVHSYNNDRSKIISGMELVISNAMLQFILKFNFTIILLLPNHGFLDVLSYYTFTDTEH